MKKILLVFVLINSWVVADSSFQKRVLYDETLEFTYVNSNAFWQYNNDRNYSQPLVSTSKKTLAVLDEYDSATIIGTTYSENPINNMTFQYNSPYSVITHLNPSHRIRIARDDGSEGEAIEGVFYGPGTLVAYYTFTEIRAQTYLGNSDSIAYPPRSGWINWNYGIDISNEYIVRVSDNSPEQVSKFSVALNNDGNRVALGIKTEATNAIIRVYEFNGAEWEQLGTDID